MRSLTFFSPALLLCCVSFTASNMSLLLPHICFGLHFIKNPSLLTFFSFLPFFPFISGSTRVCVDLSVRLRSDCSADWHSSAVHLWDHLCILPHRSVWVAHTNTQRSPHHHSPWTSSGENYLYTRTHRYTHTPERAVSDIICAEWVVLIGQSTGADPDSGEWTELKLGFDCRTRASL